MAAPIASPDVVGVPSTEGPVSPAVPFAERPDVLADAPAAGEEVIFVDPIPTAGTLGSNDDTLVYDGGIVLNPPSRADADHDDEGNDEEGDVDVDRNVEEADVDGSREGTRLSAGLLMTSSPAPGHPPPTLQRQSSTSSDTSLPSQVFIPSVNSSTGSTPDCPIEIDATSQGSSSPPPLTPGGNFTRLVIVFVVYVFF